MFSDSLGVGFGQNLHSSKTDNLLQTGDRIRLHRSNRGVHFEVTLYNIHTYHNWTCLVENCYSGQNAREDSKKFGIFFLLLSDECHVLCERVEKMIDNVLIPCSSA
jgi:hypothetical protein